MNPEGLPMQRLHQFGYWERLAGNILLASTRNAEDALELVGKYFNKTRKHFHPIVEDISRAVASSQVKMSLHEIVNEFDIARLDHRFKINRGKIAALFGEVALFIEDVSNSAAHTCRKVPAAGTQHDDQAVGHVFAAVIAYTFNDCSRAGVADGKALSGHAAEEGFSTRRAIKNNVADKDIFFRRELRLP